MGGLALGLNLGRLRAGCLCSPLTSHLWLHCPPPALGTVGAVLSPGCPSPSLTRLPSAKTSFSPWLPSFLKGVHSAADGVILPALPG